MEIRSQPMGEDETGRPTILPSLDQRFCEARFSADGNQPFAASLRPGSGVAQPDSGQSFRCLQTGKHRVRLVGPSPRAEKVIPRCFRNLKPNRRQPLPERFLELAPHCALDDVR